jgi:hypothetical protein
VPAAGLGRFVAKIVDFEVAAAEVALGVGCVVLQLIAVGQTAQGLGLHQEKRLMAKQGSRSAAQDVRGNREVR